MVISEEMITGSSGPAGAKNTKASVAVAAITMDAVFECATPVPATFAAGHMHWQ
jgi:hypothetical protein